MISARKPTAASLRQAAGLETPDAAVAVADAPEAGDILEQQTVEASACRPAPVATIAEMGLSDTLVEALLFKYLLAVGHDTGRGLATAIATPPKPIIEMLAQLKGRQFVYHKDSTTMGDFHYGLTDAGRARAGTYMEECSYVGPAPVTLEDYCDSVVAQSITLERARREDLRRAFEGLLINEEMFDRLGPAVNSGRGLFLHGFPGNGKTSIAERVTACFGGSVWVPHAIWTAGHIITFYDPENHHAIGDDKPAILRGQATDRRWIEIRRPTIVAGGELVMSSLDLQHNPETKITEPSLQLKSNTGTLVIDDFGRQRMSPIELLNRWIVPLENRFDFLTLASGKKIKVPFDQLIIFSTNLEPRDLVDEAFLRRIPYKINVIDPTEDEFRKLFELVAPGIGVEFDPAKLDYLLETHYRAAGRKFRCCHPRDLLLQIKNASAYKGIEPVADEKAFDAAIANYFAVM